MPNSSFSIPFYICGQGITCSNIKGCGRSYRSNHDTIVLMNDSLATKDELISTIPNSSFIRLSIPENVPNYSIPLHAAYGPPPSYIRKVSSGADYCLILLNDGSLFSCGMNEHKQLAITPEQWNESSNDHSETKSSSNFDHDHHSSQNTLTERKIFQVKLLEHVKIKTMECGSHYSLIVSENNDLYGCGVNDYNQISLGETFSRYPQLVDYGREVGDEITHVACCFSFSLFVLNSRKLRLMGQNWVYEQDIHQKLSNGRLSPKQDFHVFDCNVKKIVTGGFHFVVLLQNGTVYGGGDNASNQYGNFDHENQNTIFYNITEKNFENQQIIDVSCGGDNTAFLTADGELYVCGINNHQFTAKYCERYSTMTKMDYKRPLVRIFAGDSYSCAILDDGTMTLRGKNEKHQLGSILADMNENTFHMKCLFPEIHNPSDITVSMGYYNTVVYCSKSLSITKHFLFISKRINCEHLSDVAFIVNTTHLH
ncbi:hypothetical protein C9374_007305 [Naegleria lovaniensis]|uniref:Uncharacterized protein n=1 Tax=Naegleria lovaniensis TaxID=51637 RepID=A0AA88KSK5_NAELO|nr:uncharacterized protein C9374_007305 [Naegleria lovaniensis]KAG2393774.1 hypothetical protein C9374_007305 [Naegleria lovaniensis]